MKYLIVIDIDGTLFNSNNQVSKRTRKAIESIKKLGHYIVLCSGRPRHNVIDICHDIGASEIIISSTGTEIFDIANNKIIDSLYLPLTSVIKMYEYAHKYSIKMKISSFDYEYVNIIQDYFQTPIPKDIINFFINNPIKQIMFIYHDNELLEAFKKYINWCTKVKIVDETVGKNEPWFSVNNLYASKGKMVLNLANYLKIFHNNIITIGNDYNDISMFHVTKKSYVMDNANDIVKNHATYITKSNDNDGVAIILENFLQEKTP